MLGKDTVALDRGNTMIVRASLSQAQVRSTPPFSPRPTPTPTLSSPRSSSIHSSMLNYLARVRPYRPRDKTHQIPDTTRGERIITNLTNFTYTRCSYPIYPLWRPVSARTMTDGAVLSCCYKARQSESHDGARCCICDVAASISFHVM